jgi:hypothetical protein
MPVIDARLRVHHPCPYCDVSVRYPRTLLLLWCDNRRDVFLVSSPAEEELRRVLRTLRGSFHARVLLRDAETALVEVPDFEWAEPISVTRLAREESVWAVPPVVYFEGRETYRFVSDTRPRLNRLITRVRHLGGVEILSLSNRTTLDTIRDLPVASVHFFEGLTRAQVRSLVAAYEGGLLEIPSRDRWADVARRQGLSRSTFGEHLRKAQLRLLENSYASLKARAQVRGAPVLLPRLPGQARVAAPVGEAQSRGKRSGAEARR